MTDEEKAEEYANGIEYCDMVHNDISGGYTILYDKDQLIQAVMYGLTEGKPKWHDLRKNPDDLPDNGRRVLVKDKSRREYDIACLCRCKDGSDFWSYERFTSSVKDNYVIAWCELLKFEE